MLVIFFILFVTSKFDSNVASEKMDFCENLQCGDSEAICGIRQEGEGYRLRLFDSECDLLKYGCKVENNLGKYYYFILLR